ncbi:MAG TPA: uroporphyrinogen-III synthase [Usitatibacter sp.]|jgi:uroporphyrinogen-III synthase|nr:uroporphyrinogen-III synthase [Usitatibacter sp.]
MSAGALQGMGVVITRPRAAALPLAAALEREGARTFIFPALAIEPMEPTGESAQALANLAGCTLAIFVSANAVEAGLAAARRAGPWPEGARVAGIGEATARALREAGFADVISPRERHDSEALLAMPALASLRGEDVLIFRGEGGREHLRAVLASRGAIVRYVECYRRTRPQADPRPLREAWRRGEVNAVSALSAETLENFIAMMGEDAASLFASAALVVPHEAIAAHPDARRFARAVVSSPGAPGLIRALQSVHVTP